MGEHMIANATDGLDLPRHGVVFDLLARGVYWYRPAGKGTGGGGLLMRGEDSKKRLPKTTVEGEGGLRAPVVQPVWLQMMRRAPGDRASGKA